MSPTQRTAVAKPTTSHKVLGQLPAGWKMVELGDMVDRSRAKYDPERSNMSLPVIELEHIEPHTGRLLGVAEDNAKASTKNEFLPGQVLFGKLRPYLRKFHHPDFHGACSSEVWVMEGKEGNCDNGFLYYLVQGHQFLGACLKTTGSKMPRADWDLLATIAFPFPPLREQRRIARILSTWDKAISLLQEQITAKELRLRGLIDQLVSGQRHGATNGQLPKGWRWVRLGEVGSFKKGKGIAKSDLRETGTPCITYGELYTLHHIRVKRFHSHITPETAKASERIHNGDILFAGSGETSEEIGKAAVFLGNEEAYAGGDVIILRSKKIDPLYLSTALSSEIADRQRLKFGQGNSVVHLYPSQLAEFIVPLPPSALQQQIAGVVRAVDEELDVLRTRLEQLQLQKKGLMQGLLSGRQFMNE